MKNYCPVCKLKYCTPPSTINGNQQTHCTRCNKELIVDPNEFPKDNKTLRTLYNKVRWVAIVKRSDIYQYIAKDEYSYGELGKFTLLISRALMYPSAALAQQAIDELTTVHHFNDSRVGEVFQTMELIGGNT